METPSGNQRQGEDRKQMEEGLHAIDLLVPRIRELIPEEILYEGFRRVVTFNLSPHSYLLTKCVIRNNKQADYWIKELQGVDRRLFRYAEKVNGFKRF